MSAICVPATSAQNIRAREARSFRSARIACWIWACACVGLPANLRAAEPTFEKDVRPVLKAYCLDCHGGSEKLASNLDLRLKRFAVKGGDGGPAIVPGQGSESALVERMRAGEMPPGEKKVPPELIDLVSRWIDGGAVVSRDEPESLPPGIDITPEERSYWAFQPLRRPDIPASAPEERVRNEVDALVAARLREKKLAFNPDAEKRTLLKRATLDLTGLAPTAEEMAAFLADTSEQAYENALDRLLASPRYGERWARHWLDVAGYSESEGNGSDDTPRPFAWKYRDWVIRALNDDMPLDRFIIEQLAGDELVPYPWTNLKPEQLEKLAATGFLRMVADTTATGGVDEAAGANQVMADMLKVVGSSLLGMSVGCAQCHDHRYDPIPQEDYFRLRAIFEPSFDPSHWRRPVQRNLSLYTDADRAKAAAVEAEANAMQAELQKKIDAAIADALEKELLKFPEDQRTALGEAARAPADKRTPEQQALMKSNPKLNINAGVLYQYNEAAANEIKKENEKIAAKRAERPVEDYISVLQEQPGVVPPTHLHYRGDHRQPKQAVKPGDLTIAAPDGARFEIAEKDPGLETTGRRLAFARHLTSGTHPLFGRVMANRLWLHHFGRGLVDTPGEFGVLGSRPSHPELLDLMATEWPKMGWSIKRMHRFLMTSTTYRQSSRRDAQRDTVDTDGSLYSRFPVRRLDAEALRDRALQASGRLDATPFGPSVPVAEDFVGQIAPANDSPRRGIYLQTRRSKPVSFLTAFDAPVMTVNCDRRVQAVSSPQALTLMNGEFALREAKGLAERLRKETAADYARETTDPIAAAYPRPGDLWSYGHGSFDETKKRTASFTALPHFSGTYWQGGPAIPDPTLGFVLLHAAGGHAGNDQAHATIRRWTSPGAGKLTISGKFAHAGGCGDGVRGRIVSSRTGLAGEWTVKDKAEVATPAADLEVQPGDTLDFVVDCLAEVSCDSFVWTVELKLAGADGSTLAASNSATEFAGPRTATWPQLAAKGWEIVHQRPADPDELVAACRFLSDSIAEARATGQTGDLELAALTSLCQQLLISNEFLYVD